MILSVHDDRKYPKNTAKGREVAIPPAPLIPTHTNAYKFACKLV